MVPGESLRELIRANGITVATFPPSVLRLLTDEAAPLKTIIVGGEACGEKLVERFAGRHRFFNCYGPTEAGICATALECAPGGPVSIGRPLLNVTVCIVDEGFQRVPPGQIGQICFGGAGIGYGYLNLPALTAERFIPDPWSDAPGRRLYCTGDLGRYLPDGSLQFEGRMDGQIKIHGLRIEPGEIEEALRKLPWISNAAVVARETGELKDKVLVAYVETERTSPNKDELRRFLLKSLPEFMVPAIFVFLKQLPLTVNCKIDRQALPAPQPEPVAVATRQPSATEATVLEIWSRVLSAPGVGVESNFFDLGGHSLLANQIIARLQEIFNVDIALPQIFATPTVASLAGWIDREIALAGMPQPRNIAEMAPANGHGQRRFNARSSPLIEFCGTGAKSPLFFVNPGGGEVFCYANLAKHLGTGQPFYSFRSIECEDNATADTIAAMAQRNLEALHEFGMHPPLFLGGWSLGGVIAYEMACQLQRAGEEPPLVILLDAAVPSFSGELDDVLVFREFALDIERLYRTGPLEVPRLPELGPGERLRSLAEKIRDAGGPTLESGELETAFRRFRINYLAAHVYRPKTYQGSVTLLMTTGSIQDSGGSCFGWGPFLEGETVLHEVPGDHYTMLVPPYSQVLAEKITACLAGARMVKSAHS